MKKLFVLFSVIICLIVSSVSVFAAEDLLDENTSTIITVSFKAGTTSYTVNGKAVKAEASAVVQGKTFVPVKVITDALGASFTPDLKKKTAVIKYNDVEIKITDKKKEAVIAGKKTKMDAAPYIKNSSFMASVTFLADVFGADLKNSGGKVTFTKEIANPNSIKDFGTIIKNTNKTKVGDSYYKWSMKLPRELTLSSRTFNGDNNFFISQDESYGIMIAIKDKDKDATLEDEQQNLREEAEDSTLIDYGIYESNGIEYAEIVYKGSDVTFVKRVYMTDTKEFVLLLLLENDKSYLDNKYQDLIDSFQFKFSKDGSTEDLSDVSATGYRKYQDTQLKWSAKILPYWREYKDDNIHNEVQFDGLFGEIFSVKIYSLEKGETLDSITSSAIKNYECDYNPEIFKFERQESAVIGGVKCSKIYYKYNISDKPIYGCDIFFVGKNYKYVLCYELSEESYNDSSKRMMVEGMVNSFRFEQLDLKATGKLMDPSKITSSTKTRTFDDDYYSFKLPSGWKTSQDNTDDFKQYYSSDGYLSLAITTVDMKLPSSDFFAGLDQYFNSLVNKNLKLESKTAINEKGTFGYKYVLNLNTNDTQYRQEIYVLTKGNQAIQVTLTANSFYYGSKNKEIVSSIWNSFTLK
ncbi:stalk domain-containing protein [Ruminiclostridium cellulolyticum]|uniref:Copper amine oxidase domain protein n=1 Tax=Ruminiclostridium cellulolyticum (strain ATCC 35319 / DSM 5812 / JCM 6584 / H10) TaxID=394503 RepID=B8I2S6_RUMCH|nr:stalk domain-containing protein [Ruminiclostridium cellulolyticum]ACL76069.1 copper amine oxidase domain protein [Ruminiclostridium cellulolyticum H10]